MNIKCRKCGALVPSDHAFCTDCGAVMAEPSPAPRAGQGEGSDEALISTIVGQPIKPPSRPAAGGRRAPAEAPPPAREPQPAREQAARPAATVTPAPARPVTTQEKVATKSSPYIYLGFGVVLLLGLLLFYLLSVIFSR